MAISIKRYVDIVSGIGAGAGVAARQLIGRIFNDNPLIPVGSVLEFTSAANVGAYFGLTSMEYLRAVFYFGFVSKTVSAPPRLSFARYAKATAPARIYGGFLSAKLADFTAVAAGTLSVTVGGQTAALVAIDLSACISLAAVATVLQTAFRAAAGSQFAGATVTYDAVGQKFDFVATTAGAAAIAVAPGTLAGLLGWTASDAVLSPGTDVQTIDGAVQASVDVSNNFGSFCFAPALGTPEILAAAQWNAANGVQFMFCVPVVDAATAETVYAALADVEGVAITYAPTAGEYDEMCPMIVMAATDYTRRGAVQSYMFQSFGLTAKVGTDGLADTLDGVRTNYYGVTQTAGQKIAFYQRGVLTGGPTAPTDQNVFANECWLKDAAQAAVMTGLLSLPEVPANATGRGQILGLLQAPIEQATRNGVISVGKTLTPAQQLFVTQQTGDPKAWRQVQSIGYWVDVAIQPVVTDDGRTEYEAIYSLIYSKDDTIRKVNGSHALV